MPGRSIEDLLSRAMGLAASGPSRGIGVAVNSDLAIVCCDFKTYITLGRRPTGLVIPPNTLIDGGFVYTKRAVVGTYELMAIAPADLGGPIANAAIGVGAALPRLIIGANGATIQINSAANVTDGYITAYLNLIPLP